MRERGEGGNEGERGRMGGDGMRDGKIEPKNSQRNK